MRCQTRTLKKRCQAPWGRQVPVLLYHPKTSIHVDNPLPTQSLSPLESCLGVCSAFLPIPKTSWQYQPSLSYATLGYKPGISSFNVNSSYTLTFA